MQYQIFYRRSQPLQAPEPHPTQRMSRVELDRLLHETRPPEKRQTVPMMPRVEIPIVLDEP